VRTFIGLLDFGDPQEVALWILEVGEKHVPGAVAPTSVHALCPHVAQANDNLRQFRAARYIELSVLKPTPGQRNKAKRVVVRVAAKKCHQSWTGSVTRIPSTSTKAGRSQPFRGGFAESRPAGVTDRAK
jgi:hypothetical protein